MRLAFALFAVGVAACSKPSSNEQPPRPLPSAQPKPAPSASAPSAKRPRACDHMTDLGLATSEWKKDGGGWRCVAKSRYFGDSPGGKNAVHYIVTGKDGEAYEARTSLDIFNDDGNVDAQKLFGQAIERLRMTEFGRFPDDSFVALQKDRAGQWRVDGMTITLAHEKSAKVHTRRFTVTFKGEPPPRP